MNRQQRVGLVAEGKFTQSRVLHLPRLGEELGPIKSTALRMARRISNSLSAGYGVSGYEELGGARLILLHVPDGEVGRVVGEFCATELPLDQFSFVLCESWLMTDVMQPLRARGASVATLVDVPGAGRSWFVIEGDVGAVRPMRRLLERNDARGMELRADSKHLYFAARLLVTALPVPLFVAAQTALRESGMSGNSAHLLLDTMARTMIREFLKGGRGSWGGPLTECSVETANTHLAALRRTDPNLAEIVEQEVTCASSRLARTNQAMAARVTQA